MLKFYIPRMNKPSGKHLNEVNAIGTWDYNSCRSPWC